MEKRNFKGFLKSTTGKISTGVGTAMLTVGNCFADEALNTAMTGSMTTVKGDITGAVAVIAPIAMAIGGTFLAWRKGWGFFKSVAK